MAMSSYSIRLQWNMMIKYRIPKVEGYNMHNNLFNESKYRIQLNSSETNLFHVLIA